VLAFDLHRKKAIESLFLLEGAFVAIEPVVVMVTTATAAVAAIANHTSPSMAQNSSCP
jgi:hypothetical protein